VCTGIGHHLSCEGYSKTSRRLPTNFTILHLYNHKLNLDVEDYKSKQAKLFDSCNPFVVLNSHLALSKSHLVLPVRLQTPPLPLTAF
jgi:hypothetical protein